MHTPLFDDGCPSGHEDVIDVVQLGELLVSAGILTVSEAERFLGADIDDDDEWWENDGNMAAAGGNPQLRTILNAEAELANPRGMFSAEPSESAHDKYRRLLGIASHQSAEHATAEAKEHLMVAVCKAGTVHGTGVQRGGSYSKRHLTAGGNWAYSYSTTGGRLDNAAYGHSTGNKAGQVHKDSNSTEKTPVVVGQTHNVRFGGKHRAVKPKNKDQARGLARLLAARKVHAG